MIKKSFFSSAMYAKCWLWTFFMVMGFAACGEEGSSNGGENFEDNPREVQSINDLDSCTSERAGNTIYVREKMSDYVCLNHIWVAVALESILGICDEKSESRIDSTAEVWYVCRSKIWEKASELDYDTYGLTGVEGDVKAGVVNKNKYYVYENGVWRAVAENEMEAVLGVCNVAREGVIEDMAGIYYICNLGEWKQATTLEYDTYGWENGVVGEVKKGNVTDVEYVYKDGKWLSTSLELCSSANEGKIAEEQSVHYICKLGVWEKATTLEYDTYGWKTGAIGEVRKGNVTDAKYVYRDDQWLKTSLDFCSSANEEKIAEEQSVYYICKSNVWKTATTLEYDTYGFTCLQNGAIVSGKVVSSNKYVCDDGKFREASNVEVTLDLGCTSYTQNQTIKYEDEWEKTIWFCSSKWAIKVKNFKYVLFNDTRNERIESYNTVKIGDQIWMAQNLNYSTPDSYCYDNISSNCDRYGRLYTLSDALNACPDGWHLPSGEEWKIMFSKVGVENNVGTLLKSTSGWVDYGNGDDAYGFAVLPGGYFAIEVFEAEGFFAAFLSSNLRIFEIGCEELPVFEYPYTGNGAYSVRCIRDTDHRHQM
ncbi:MAG: fibrobacter succinogenes major paralogous domain-containing protein [Fibrobacter sp.]|nr:fibrobacter succinogenes major paralogous domain-containing protein [Fibrobacter sp.]